MKLSRPSLFLRLGGAPVSQERSRQIHSTLSREDKKGRECYLGEVSHREPRFAHKTVDKINRLLPQGHEGHLHATTPQPQARSQRSPELTPAENNSIMNQSNEFCCCRHGCSGCGSDVVIPICDKTHTEKLRAFVSLTGTVTGGGAQPYFGTAG